MCRKQKDVGRALPDKNPQPDIDAFGAFGLFQHPATHIDVHRRPAHGHRISTIRTRLTGGMQQRLGQRLNGLRHGGILLEWVKDC